MNDDGGENDGIRLFQVMLFSQHSGAGQRFPIEGHNFGDGSDSLEDVVKTPLLLAAAFVED